MTSAPPQEGQSSTVRWNRLSLAIMGAGFLSLIGAAALFTLILTGTVSEGQSGPGTTSGIGNIDAYLQAQAVQPTPEGPPPSEAAITRITIPRFDVDAPIVIRGVDSQGVMETPDGPTDVAWYEFSARPGFGSNAVFSAHVDYIDYGPAVFWNLKDLEVGDVIEVTLADGTMYQYATAAREQVSANVSPDEIARIIGATEEEIITLITCGGTFDAAVGQYDERVIVRAERILDVASANSQ